MAPRPSPPFLDLDEIAAANEQFDRHLASYESRFVVVLRLALLIALVGRFGLSLLGVFPCCRRVLSLWVLDRQEQIRLVGLVDYRRLWHGQNVFQMSHDNPGLNVQTSPQPFVGILDHDDDWKAAAPRLDFLTDERDFPKQ